MAETQIRNSDWEDDIDLKNDLAKFVRLNLKRLEILDFMRKDYPMYAWSLRSLARQMQYLGIQFTDYDVEVNDLEAAVEKEISGPGKLLGYRAMHKKIREIHGLQVPRDLVYAVMTKVDEERGGVGEAKRPRRDKVFVSGVSTSANVHVRHKIRYFSPILASKIVWYLFITH